MSLLVWIPMVHGNCKDQGLLGVETSVINTVTYVDGKLGKAAQIGNGNQVTNGVSINTNLVEELGTQYSCSVWVKPLGNHVHYEGAIISSGDWNHKRWAFGVNQDNSCVDIFCGGHNRNVTCSVPINQWTHLISVNDNGNVNLYKNGILVSTTDASSWPLDSDATNTTIGRETYANGYFSFNGCIQDLRIYNHALSPLEVKHLAQGLVLHYPLNRGGFGGENLILTSQYVTSGGNANGITRTYEQDGTMKIVSTSGNGHWASLGFASNSNTNVGNNLSVGDTYTISVDVKVTSGTSLPTLFINNGNSYKQLNGDIKLGQWIRAYYTSTWQEPGTTYGNISLHLGFSNAIGTYYFKNFKLEKNSSPTPWTPAPSDALYSQLGLDNNIEYDVSGYGNNGTEYGTLTYSSDTPRYNTSAVFNGTDNCIQFPFNDFCINGDVFTMNIWWKKTELGSKSYETLIGGPSGFEMDTRAGGAQALSLYMTSTRGGNVYSPFNMNEWHMVTLVNDGTNELYYVNGVLVNTIAKKNMPSGNYYVGAWSNKTAQNFKGFMSDFRFYKTALSADDVMALYKNAGYVDSDGNVYAYEMTE